MKLKTFLLTGISSLALGIFPIDEARAQVQISCTTLDFGDLADCDHDRSRITLRPNGTSNVNEPCIGVVVPHTASQCIINSGAIPPTNNVRVEFPDGQAKVYVINTIVEGMLTQVDSDCFNKTTSLVLLSTEKINQLKIDGKLNSGTHIVNLRRRFGGEGAGRDETRPQLVCPPLEHTADPTRFKQ